MAKKMLAATAMGLLVTGLSGVATGTPVQWKLKDGGNGHVYDIVVHDSHPWGEMMNGIYFKDAVTAAKAMGGYLATPGLSGEASFIYDNVIAPTVKGMEQYYWLGAYCPESEQGYRWVDGDTVTGWGGYTSMEGACSDTPYGVVQGGSDGAALQDLALSKAANGYIVEFDAPLPDQSPEEAEAVDGERLTVAPPEPAARVMEREERENE